MKKGLIIVLAVGILYFSYSYFNNKKNVASTIYKNSKETQIQNGWQSVSKNEIITAFKNDPSKEINQSIISFVQEVDLTGDGISEGLYVTGEGATGNSVTIFGRDVSGEIIALKQKQIDEKLYLATLTQASGAQYQNGYMLLPKESGFYIFSKNNVGVDKPAYVCNSFVAYKWSINNNQFEQNEELRQKYQNVECGIAITDAVVDLLPKVLRVGNNVITAKVLNRLFVEGAVYFEVYDGATQVMIGIPGYPYDGRMVSAINEEYTNQYVDIRHEINIPSNLKGKILTVRFIAASGNPPESWETKIKVE